MNSGIRTLIYHIQELGSKYFVGNLATNAQPLAFQAWGKHRRIEGLYAITNLEKIAMDSLDGAVDDYFNGRITMLAWRGFLVNLWIGELIQKMTKSHSFPSIYYGLLHDNEGWNAYDDINRP